MHVCRDLGFISTIFPKQFGFNGAGYGDGSFLSFSGLFADPFLSGVMEVFLHVRCIPQQNSQWQFWASVCVCPARAANILLTVLDLCLFWVLLGVRCCDAVPIQSFGKVCVGIVALPPSRWNHWALTQRGMNAWCKVPQSRGRRHWTVGVEERCELFPACQCAGAFALPFATCCAEPTRAHHQNIHMLPVWSWRGSFEFLDWEHIMKIDRNCQVLSSKPTSAYSV